MEWSIITLNHPENIIIAHPSINSIKNKFLSPKDLVLRTLIYGTHREKHCFTQFSTRMVAWLLLTFFICFIQSTFYKFHYYPLLAMTGYRCLEIMIHQIDIKNKWLLLFSKFYGKILVGFLS